jgi:hypothetical protein
MLQAGKTCKLEKKMRCKHVENLGLIPRILYRENNVKNYFCKTCFDNKYFRKECANCKVSKEIKDFIIIEKNDQKKEFYCDLNCYKKVNEKIVENPTDEKSSPENITDNPLENFSDFHKRLFSACKAGHLYNVQEIINSCSKIFLKNYLSTCHDIVSVICQEGHVHLLKYLITKGLIFDKNQALLTASTFGKIRILKYLIKNGADIHANDDLAVRYAIENGHVETVKYLHSIEVGVNPFTTSVSGFIFACGNGHLKMVDYLMDKNVDLGNKWRDAIFKARENGHINIVKYIENVMEKRGIFNPPSNFHYLTDNDFKFINCVFKYIGKIFPILIHVCDSDIRNGNIIHIFQKLSKEISHINIGVFQYDTIKYPKVRYERFTRFYMNQDQNRDYIEELSDFALKDFISRIFPNISLKKEISFLSVKK